MRMRMASSWRRARLPLAAILSLLVLEALFPARASAGCGSHVTIQAPGSSVGTAVPGGPRPGTIATLFHQPTSSDPKPCSGPHCGQSEPFPPVPSGPPVEEERWAAAAHNLLGHDLALPQLV